MFLFLYVLNQWQNWREKDQKEWQQPTYVNTDIMKIKFLQQNEDNKSNFPDS